MSAGNGDDRKVVCLGMPHYGQLTAGAARGFYHASRKFLVHGQQQGSSLLAMNMNILWAWALNVARAGRVDYFGMQHSDVEPEEWWADAAVDEMEARGLDVLGVVAPIKDQRGCASVALAKPDGDTWDVRCRLTMREVYRLPETFTSEDVGHRLLINTGLWVCKFNEAWAREVHFEINDRIAFDPERGVYFAQNEPEDWFISRLFHELGLKVGCTRKIALGHRGEAVFGNTKPWGTQEYDEQHLKASTLACPDGAWFPATVAGWLTREEGEELARLADGKVVLEVGSYCGRSTVCLAQRAQSVTAVDPFDGRGTAAQGDTFDLFRANVVRHGVGGRVQAMRGTSAEVLPTLPPVYDLAFVDGAHDRESVLRDAALAGACLKPGGVIAFHDYGRPDDPGVTAAVDELLAGGGELLGRVDSLAVVRPPAVGAHAGNGNGAGNGEGACDGTRRSVSAR